MQAAELPVNRQRLLFQALDEEKVVYDRSSSKNIYLNVAVNTLKKLRGKSGALAPPPSMSAPLTTSPVHHLRCFLLP